MPDECVFCRIIRGDEPATVVHRWADAMAIVPLNPVTPGHLLVIPIQHTRDITEDAWVSATAMRRAAEVAQAPCNIITSAGPEATQSVPHLHIHVVPRVAGDGLALPWTGQAERGRLVPDRPGETVAECGCPITYAVAKVENHTRECGTRKAAERLARHLAEEYGDA